MSPGSDNPTESAEFSSFPCHIHILSSSITSRVLRFPQHLICANLEIQAKRFPANRRKLVSCLQTLFILNHSLLPDHAALI